MAAVAAEIAVGQTKRAFLPAPVAGRYVFRS